MEGSAGEEESERGEADGAGVELADAAGSEDSVSGDGDGAGSERRDSGTGESVGVE